MFIFMPLEYDARTPVVPAELSGLEHSIGNTERNALIRLGIATPIPCRLLGRIKLFGNDVPDLTCQLLASFKQVQDFTPVLPVFLPDFGPNDRRKIYPLWLAPSFVFF
jgi:hypothetical protein